LKALVHIECPHLSDCFSSTSATLAFTGTGNVLNNCNGWKLVGYKKKKKDGKYKKYRRRKMLFKLSQGILKSISVDVEVGPWCGSVMGKSVLCQNDITGITVCLKEKICNDVLIAV